MNIHIWWVMVLRTVKKRCLELRAWQWGIKYLALLVISEKALVLTTVKSGFIMDVEPTLTWNCVQVCYFRSYVKIFYWKCHDVYLAWFSFFLSAKKCGKIEKSLKKCDYSCPVAVNGSWSDYSEWTSCSVSCGGGSQTRDRSCSNPAPAFGGDNCEGNAEETQKCNLHECPGKILRICSMLLNIIDKLSTYSYIS